MGMKLQSEQKKKARADRKTDRKAGRIRFFSLALALAICLSIAAYHFLPEDIGEHSAAASSVSTASSGSSVSGASASGTTAALKAPSIQIKVSGYEGLTISWDKVSGASSYTVYRSTSKNGTYTKLASTSKTSYTDKKAAQNQTFYYKVRAVSSKTQSSFSSIRSGKISTVVSLKKIPAYSGSPYTEINGGTPYFAKSMYVKQSSESYSRLDSLGRCGTAYAVVGVDLMPTEERGSIGMIKPAGWHTVRYDDLIDGKYLYNRCHLIGYQLTGENANELNLITGTRYLNVEGMLPFENQVADYVQSTGNHVLYRVTPIYDGDNLLASGVQMEASSVEDNGKGLQFHVFVYNVQPGIAIDYATGDSRRASEASGGTSSAAPSGTSSASGASSASGNESVSRQYVLNTNTKKFHYPSCSSVSQMAEKNKQTITATRDAVIEQGYRPCGNCKP